MLVLQIFFMHFPNIAQSESYADQHKVWQDVVNCHAQCLNKRRVYEGLFIKDV